RFCDPIAHTRAAALLAADRPAFERFLVKQGTTRYRRAVVAQGLGRYPEAHVLAKLCGHLDALEGLLEGGPWLVGASPSIADFAIAAQLDELQRTSRHAHELHARPRLEAWLSRCQSTASS